MSPTLAQRAELSVAEEPAADENIEMANLREVQTGVPGVIFVSTRMGRHAARVKWYDGRPGRGAPSFSVSLEEPPEVVASDIEPRIARERAPQVFAWVRLNREVLAEFWDTGAELFEDERAALLARLRRLD